MTMRYFGICPSLDVSLSTLVRS